MKTVRIILLLSACLAAGFAGGTLATYRLPVIQLPELELPMVSESVEKNESHAALGIYAENFEGRTDVEDGVYVIGFASDTEAEDAGMCLGDRILEVNGTAVTAVSDIADCLNGMEAGEDAEITVERDGERILLTVQLVGGHSKKKA